MRRATPALLASMLLATTALDARAEVDVVTSIKPVHSLVAAVMAGVGEPDLIVQGAGSPHNYALKPSQAQALESAEIVFWIGREMEAFLEKPIETIASGARSVELVDAPDLVKLELRQGATFEAHDHSDEHGHDDHAHADEHDHDHSDEHAHDDHTHADEHDHAHEDDHAHDHASADHAEHSHDDHARGAFDTHVWLDPLNAKAMVHEIEHVLAAADPDNAATYEANAAAVSAQLDTLVAEVAAELEPLQDRGFIVFHDAYHYFENRFGVTAAGSVTVSPEVLPGVERVNEIRAKVQELGAACVFAEPQFEPKLVATVTEGTEAKSGVLDPLGADLTDGPDLYFELIRNMASSISACLSEAS